uniref:Uncharacterized protein n=1 Tax=Solibacter usitatus (strain Ellin6076) TaxID=234267 RepID=Q01TN5_SOLUE
MRSLVGRLKTRRSHGSRRKQPSRKKTRFLRLNSRVEQAVQPFSKFTPNSKFEMGAMKMTFTERVLAVFLSGLMSSAAYGSGNTFNKVRYNGGSIPSNVSPKDWGNKLTISPDLIVLETKGEKKGWDRFEIQPKSVTSLSYGQEAHRRVGTMIALAILVAPVALFGLFHKTRLHYIGIQYGTPDGKNGGILIQGDKDNYRAILVALQGVSNVSVSVSEKDRSFIPVGVNSTVAKEQASK